MKEIKAIIQPFMLEDVCDALARIPGLPGLTLSEVSGFGRTRGVGPGAEPAEVAYAYAKKTKLEVVVPDDQVAAVIEAIARAARTGKPGDGKIFVLDVVDAVRIRTGERGEEAV